MPASPSDREVGQAEQESSQGGVQARKDRAEQRQNLPDDMDGQAEQVPCLGDDQMPASPSDTEVGQAEQMPAPDALLHQTNKPDKTLQSTTKPVVCPRWVEFHDKSKNVQQLTPILPGLSPQKGQAEQNVAKADQMSATPGKPKPEPWPKHGGGV